MKQPLAQNRKAGSPDKLASDNLKTSPELSDSTEARALSDPSRVAKATASSTWDMLARVEGIARWGLNE